MPAAKIITPGDRFGRWTALEETETRVYSGKNFPFRLCRCDCGTVQFVGSYKLRTGHSRSCGCLLSEVTTERSLKHGHKRRGSETKAYRIWCGILKRCTNPNAPEYARYGGRGIAVCERWLKFENFLEDMGEPPDGLTIDRKDNDAGYCKENCAWRTPQEQARNTRRNVRLTFNGLTLTLVEWAEKLGVSYRRLRGRHERKWSAEEILTIPKDGKQKSLNLTRR